MNGAVRRNERRARVRGPPPLQCHRSRERDPLSTVWRRWMADSVERDHPISIDRVISRAATVTQKREITGGGKVTHRSSPFCQSKSRKTLRHRRQCTRAGTGRPPSGEGEVTRRHGRRGPCTASAAVKPASGWPPYGDRVRSSQGRHCGRPTAARLHDTVARVLRGNGKAPRCVER